MCVQSTSRRRLLTPALIAACCILSSAALGTSARAADASRRQPAPAKTPAPAEAPQYPRVTLSTWYEVDPDWPKRPENMPWGRTPGIAVDAKDRIWVFTRANPPIQVYNPAGKLVLTWGKGMIGPNGTANGSHFIRIDGRGMIWLADVSNHVVLQVTPNGKVLPPSPEMPGE